MHAQVEHLRTEREDILLTNEALQQEIALLKRTNRAVNHDEYLPHDTNAIKELEEQVSELKNMVIALVEERDVLKRHLSESRPAPVLIRNQQLAPATRARAKQYTNEGEYGKCKFTEDFIGSYIYNHRRALNLLLTLIHLTSGMPGRTTEVCDCPRNGFFVDEMFALFTTKNKTNPLTVTLIHLCSVMPGRAPELCKMKLYNTTT